MGSCKEHVAGDFLEEVSIGGEDTSLKEAHCEAEHILSSGAGGTLCISTPEDSSRANMQINVSKIGTQM